MDLILASKPNVKLKKSSAKITTCDHTRLNAKFFITDKDLTVPQNNTKSRYLIEN